MEKKIFITGTGRCGTTFLIKLFTALGYKTGYDMRELEAQTEAGDSTGGLERATRPDLVQNFAVFKELTVFKAPYYVYQIDLIIKVLGYVLAPSGQREGRWGYLVPPNTILSWTSSSGHLLRNKGRPWVRKSWPYDQPGPIHDPFVAIAEPVVKGVEACDEWSDPCSWIESFIVPIRNLKETAESAFRRQEKGYGTGGPGLVKNGGAPPTTIEEQVDVYTGALDELKAKLEFYKVPVIYLDFESMVNDKLYLYKEFSQMLEARDISQETFCEAYQRATGTWRKGDF